MERLAWYTCVLAATLGMIVLGVRLGKAQEVETVTFCDTQEQVRWINAGAPIEVVNTQYPNACGTQQIVYHKGKRVGDAGGNGIYAILIVGIATPHGLVGGDPLMQFAVLKDTEFIPVNRR